jgi:glycosyltransferase involved in cell wall biosynthesis
MKKLLVISGRGFPPENETGIFRVLKFVKYLSRLGWRSVVLAPKMNVETKKDPSLVEDIPSDTKVVRTTNLTLMLQHHSMQKLAKSFLVFDGDIGWFPTAYRKGLDIIRKEGIDAILSTSPPPTSHIVANYLKRKTRLPWIADFRDPWTQHGDYWSLSGAHRKFEDDIEQTVVGNADRLVFVTELELEGFAGKYPSVADKLALIPNGFDAEDFRDLIRRPEPRMVFSYVGSVYHHYPLTFLKALEELSNEIPGFSDNVRVVFCGKVHPDKQKEMKTYKLGNMLEVAGQVTHREALEQLANSNVLLLSFVDKPEFTRIYTTRIFNYLAIDRFILATIPPESHAADLIRKTNSGVVIHPDDVGAIKKRIGELYEEFRYRKKIAVHQNREVLAQFNRFDQTKKLAGILDDLTGAAT